MTSVRLIEPATGHTHRVTVLPGIAATYAKHDTAETALNALRCPACRATACQGTCPEMRR